MAHHRSNRIADYAQVLCYGDPASLPHELKCEEGSTLITVLEGDPELSKYGLVAPLSQAFVDLFNTPGWPAERFVHELSQELFYAAA